MDVVHRDPQLPDRSLVQHAHAGSHRPDRELGIAGSPELPGITTSNGDPRFRATGPATVTPPRGIASTVAGSATTLATAVASASPASSRSRNTLSIIAPALLGPPTRD